MLLFNLLVSYLFIQFSFFSMVDLLTVIPIWITLDKEEVAFPDIHSWDDAFVYILFGLNTTRVLRVLRVHKKLNQFTDEVRRSLGEMILTVLVLLLFSKNLVIFTLYVF
jgi:hypothetical protein